MKLSNIVILKDGRTNCWSISTTVRIIDYCKWFSHYGKDNKLDEQRPLLKTRSGNMIRSRMIEDLKQGAVLPPIVVGLALDKDIQVSSKEDVESLFDEHQDEMTVIDGMQRSEALTEALSAQQDIQDNLLRMDIWVARNSTSLIYRMLVLNTGQVPWDVKRQMDVIYRPLIKETRAKVPNITINTKNDNTRRSKAGEYQASSIVELFIAFTSRKEIVSPADRIADDFIKLDVTEMSGKPNISDYFYRAIALMVDLDSAFSIYKGDDSWLHYKCGMDLFTKNAVQVGLITAIAQKVVGMPGMTVRDSNSQEKILNEIEIRIENLCNRIKTLTSEELHNFMSFDILNEVISKLPTKKIGNAQRDFFKTGFKVLVETDDIESLSVVWQAY